MEVVTTALGVRTRSMVSLPTQKEEKEIEVGRRQENLAYTLKPYPAIRTVLVSVYCLSKRLTTQ
jgi:hypothetical protein